MSDERERVAAELLRVREAVRDRALESPTPQALPTPLPTRTPDLPAVGDAPPPPRRDPGPDGAAVNAAWPARPEREAKGLGGMLARLLRRLLDPHFEAQVAFNSHQVRFDNALLGYLETRFAETHRHYDAVLGIHGRHMGEIDERHLILQEELVAHVHDLVKRIDLVLGESEKSRLALEHALRDLRARLLRLEERLGRG